MSFTCRVMPGAVGADGQHKRLKAKENLADSNPENADSCQHHLSDFLPALLRVWLAMTAPPKDRKNGIRENLQARK